MSDLAKLEEGLRSLNLSKLIEHTKKLDDISQGFSSMMAPMYMRDFIIAFDHTNTLFSQAMRIDAQATAALKTAEAVAYFDNAPSFLDQRSVKDSSAARDRYIPLDPDVQTAQKIKAQSEAMVTFLKNKLQEFRFAYEAVKKIAYSGEYSDSPNEGM